MKKRWLAGLMTHQYKKLPVTMKMWMQFNVMPRTPDGRTAARRSATIVQYKSESLAAGLWAALSLSLRYGSQCEQIFFEVTVNRVNNCLNKSPSCGGYDPCSRSAAPPSDIVLNNELGKTSQLAPDKGLDCRHRCAVHLYRKWRTCWNVNYTTTSQSSIAALKEPRRRTVLPLDPSYGDDNE